MKCSRPLPDGKAECLLCPHLCKLKEGQTGICGARINNSGEIKLLTWGALSAMALDPVEKKPLYHFYPGHNILSVGSWGCNMRCDFCQNYHISQASRENKIEITSPAFVTGEAKKSPRNIGIAFTYNEPSIWFEYVMDTAILAKEENLQTVFVTNGFMTSDAADEYLKVIDAFNVDLKAFDNDFYRKLTGAGLKPVLETLVKIRKSGRHLEITTLVIPGKNDMESQMEEEVKWIASELGKDTPLHLSRYFPMYKRDDPATPENKLVELHEIARSHLNYVYLGNINTLKGQDTFCPGCGSIITKRRGYQVSSTGTSDGSCLKCGRTIYTDFTFSSSRKQR